MPASPWDAIKNIALRYTVKIDGTTLKDSYGISSIAVSHNINTISTADIAIAGNYTPDFSELSAIDDPVFTPGNTIEITAGYDSSEMLIFSGYILKHAVSFNGDQPVELKLSCKHQAAVMTYQKNSKQFKNKKDTEIIAQLLKNNSIESSVGNVDGEQPNEAFRQNNATDWDTMVARAEINDLYVFLDEKTVAVKKIDFSTTPVLTVASGNSLLGFNAELSAENQPASVEVYAWNNSKMDFDSTSAKEPSLNKQGNTAAKKISGKLNQHNEIHIFFSPMSASELQSFADAKLKRLRLSFLQGNASFVGTSKVKTGDLIELQGVGKKYNGDAFVSSVSHSIGKGLWKTTVKFGLENKPISEKKNFSNSPASSKLPPVHGLQTGKVVKLSGDPQSEFRILIGIPTGNENEPSPGIWARYANFYATSKAGLDFLPEVGDEVLVGYIDNDPSCPVIMGSLYGKKNNAPSTAADEKNNIKSIITRSNLKLSFDDDKKIITIVSPGKNSITISDDDSGFVEVKDQHNNSIKLSNSGIDISSAKDITIAAKGNIKLTATQKIELSATQDLTGEGMNVSLTAKTGIAVKGNATAELSASGQTTVKGGMVMIN